MFDFGITYFIMESALIVDEIITDIVRENHCIYDKRDTDFKNIRKKEICGKKFPKI